MAPDSRRGFIFKVNNGGLEDTAYDQVSSSTVTLNGIPILGPDNFNEQVTSLEVPVVLQAQNTLSVEVRGKPGGAIIIRVYPFAVIDASIRGRIFGTNPVTVPGRLYAVATAISVDGVPGTVHGDAFTVTGVPLVQGSNTLTATATREDGFSGSDSVRVVLDSAPPHVLLQYPQEGLVTRQDVAPLYTIADALDPHPAVFISPPPPYDAEGAYQMSVKASDWAGNSATETRGFVIDKTAPLIAFTVPSEGLSTNQAVVPVYTITDSLDLHPAVSVTPPPPYSTEGSHHVTLTATDWAGNQARATRSFTIDLTPPVIGGLAPVPDSTTADAQPAISARFSDALSGIETASIRMQFDGVDVTSLATIMQDGVRYHPAAALADGRHRVAVTTRDRTGNEAVSNWSFAVDATPPAIAIVAPAEGAVVATASLDLAGSVDDATATVAVNGARVLLAGNNFALAGLALAPGRNTIHIEAHDALGNSSSVALNVTCVLPLPAASLTATPPQVEVGGSVLLEWTTNNATSVSITPDIGTVDTSGRISTTINATTTYLLSATGPGGTTTTQSVVTVAERTKPVTIWASPSTIRLGETATLTWTATDATGVLLNHGIGKVQPVGTLLVKPMSTTEYVLTAASPEGAFQAATLVTVFGSVLPQPAGSFGARYQDLIPPDATVSAYDAKRFSLLTGAVRDRDNQPLGAVGVTILSHPEYGTVVTDGEGKFTLPVDGGGTLTVSYKKSGYLATHRQVDVPWNEIALVETITMIPEDAAATKVTFNGAAGTWAVHQSTVVDDEHGSRSATLVFAGDNMAYAKVDNKEIQLGAITVRATEFDTPNSMPAKLPPHSAYTYCVEMGVDGADHVRFAKPVVAYVDNFLDFPVGMAVPAGYYDRTRGAWIASDNGVVVRLLDADGDGSVDSLDANGDGIRDDLNGNGSFVDEVGGISGMARFVAGATYWRVGVTHFTPWDLNWPSGPAAGAIAPNPLANPIVAQQKSEEQGDPVSCTNSYVEHSSRVLHEDVHIPGSGLALHYASNRVAGYKTVITIPASGDSVPDVLKRIIVKLTIAGVAYEQTIAAGPNKNIQFVWDGRDYLGRSMSGTITGVTKIGYVYGAVYYSPADIAKSFSAAGTDITGSTSRAEFISWKTDSVSVKMPATQGDLAHGWTLSGYDQLDTNDKRTLYKGDGSYSNNKSQHLVTIADKWLAARDIASDPAGNLYIATDRGLVFKLDRNNSISVYAGGYAGLCGDNGPATSACFRSIIASVIADSGGNVFVSDFYNHRVRKIDKNGIVTTVAGTSWNGVGGYSGDNGPAASAKLYEPYGIALDGWGNLYIADRGNHRIRRIDTNGTITTIAGTGQAGYNGDGIPAVNAQLNMPQDLVVDAEGNIYLADMSNYRIRKIDTAGVIRTIAGTGLRKFNGNGIVATQANIEPNRLELDKDGNLYFADGDSSRIRRVDTRGIITTVVGTGVYGYSRDGVQPLAALIVPFTLSFDMSGNLLFVDNYYVRRVEGKSEDASGLTDSSGKRHLFENSGIPISVSDAATGVEIRHYTHDSDGHLVEAADRFGNVLRIQRDGAGVPVGIEVNGRKRADLSVGENGYLQSVTFPDSTRYEFVYSGAGLMTEKRDPNGNVFRHVYNQQGRLESAADPEGGNWQFSSSVDNAGVTQLEIQSAEGDLIAHQQSIGLQGTATIVSTDATGGVSRTTVSRDEMSRSEELACGARIEVQYDLDPRHQARYERGRTYRLASGITQTMANLRRYVDNNGDKSPDVVVYEKAINGKLWTTANDVEHGTITGTSPSGRQSTLSYDTDKLLKTQSSVPGLFPVHYEYDLVGRPVTMRVGNRTTTTAYDNDGNLASLTTSDNQTYGFGYDLLDRPRSEARPDGSKVEYQYDANGNRTTLTSPGEVAFSFGYNANNQRRNYVQPLSGAYQYSYDRDRRILSVVAPSGKSITSTYAQGNLATTTSAEGLTRYEYLCGGRLGSTTGNGERITFGYDGPLLTNDTRSGTLATGISYTYNNDFAVTSATYSGATVVFGYDNDGLLTSAGGFTISRNAQNGLPEGLSGRGLAQTRIFNGYGEQDGSASSTGGGQTYSWSLPVRDNAGRILRREESIGGGTIAWEYSYSAVGRLIEVKKDGQIVESYSYDGNGNRLTETNTLRGIVERAYGHTAEDHALSAGPDGYQYDVDGYLQSKTQAEGQTTYEYSSFGELLRVDLPDGRIITYVHDPVGRRIAKQVNGTTVEKYLWKDQTTLLAVYDGSDNLTQRFTYADARVPLSMTAGGATYLLHADQVGSLRVVADTTGVIVKRIDYDSFGNILSDSNPAFEIPFGFAGGLHDRDTGLVRFGFRDYDPSIGRFTAKDPIDFSGGDTNLYAYTMSDPVNLVDPSGLYGSDVHFDMTLKWALAAGIEPRIAVRIASANQGVDESYLSVPENPINWLFGTIFHFQSEGYALTGLSQALDQGSLEQFGKFLHILQDSFAHEGSGFPFGHARKGTGPDNYCAGSARDTEMRDMTNLWLQEFERTLGKGFHPSLMSR